MNDDKIKPLPCPFCNGRVIYQADGDYWHERLDGCPVKEFFDPVVWNRRPIAQELREAQPEFVKEYLLGQKLIEELQKENERLRAKASRETYLMNDQLIERACIAESQLSALTKERNELKEALEYQKGRIKRLLTTDGKGVEYKKQLLAELINDALEIKSAIERKE